MLALSVTPGCGDGGSHRSASSTVETRNERHAQRFGDQTSPELKIHLCTYR